jgi:hypothetical protein
MQRYTKFHNEIMDDANRQMLEEIKITKQKIEQNINI